MAGDEGVVTRSHVPGRREAILGGCGRTVLVRTPRPMTLRAHLGSIRMVFTNIARTGLPE
jgi:hypothetical protein